MERRRKVKPRNTPSPDDIYVRGVGTYRVLAYNETDDTVLLCTTNDIITFPGKIRRTHLKKNGFWLCPLELRQPAIEVFELDNKLSDKSLDLLKAYRSQHSKIYERLQLIEILGDDVNSDFAVRTHVVPDEQGDQFPQLKGKSFKIPVPFYCLVKQIYKGMNQVFDMSSYDYAWAMSKCRWPIFYVPQAFRG
jgi:hypothetical protein